MANPSVLSALSDAQKKIILNCNKKYGAGFALPLFPLWAFYDDEINLKEAELSACIIDGACCVSGTLYFPVKISLKNKDLPPLLLKINFASVKRDVDEVLLSEGLQKKSHVLSSFRTGKVLLENNTWALYEEKWISI